MGVTSSTATASSARLPTGVSNLVGELGNDIQYEQGMGSSRFLKAIKVRHRYGPLVVKTFVKPEAYYSLRPLVRRLRIEREALADVPNTLTYQKVVETETAGYLIRQWMSTNLYDRISTRPFLTTIEKKWITFQLLQAMMEARRHNVPHGDLKSENVLVTSSLSVYIADFAASFKQVYLPLNDPSDFNFYFGTSGRRTCYIAPERFYSQDSEIAKAKAKARTEASNAVRSGEQAGVVDAGAEKLAELFKRDGKVTEAMDVFSLGCVIAELWRDGAPIFTLMQLFKFRESNFDVGPALAEIPDSYVRDMVRSMVALDPAKRKSFATYLDQARGECFPDIFYTFLHRYLTTLQRTSPRTASVASAESEPSNVAAAAPTPASGRPPGGASNAPSAVPSDSHNGANSDMARLFRAEADERIERVYEEWSVVARVLDGDADALELASATPNTERAFSPQESATMLPTHEEAARTDTKGFYVLSLGVSIPGIDQHALTSAKRQPGEDGPALLVLSPLLSNLRNAVRPSSKLHCFDLILHLSARWISDEAKLDRVLPYLISMIDDESVLVRAGAVRCTVQLLALVETITPSNASTFLDYVMPNLRPVTRDSSSLVRATYATCLVDLTKIGTKYMQMTSAMRAEGVFAADADGRAGGDAADFLDGEPRAEDETSFDRQMELVRTQIQEEVILLLSDGSPVVKRSILTNIGPLCVFFGATLTNDVILSHMITFLNDRSWMLRQAFFDAIPIVAQVAGARSVEDYILTLLLQALSDPEEFVVLHVLFGLAQMLHCTTCGVALVSQAKVLDVTSAVAGFLCHPNHWLRSASSLVLSVGARQLGTTEIWALLYPSIRPLLRCDVREMSPARLLFAAKKPLSREVLQKTMQWASRAKSSRFWKPPMDEAKGKAGLANGLGREGLGLFASIDGKGAQKTPIQRSEEDDAYFDGLRSSGLSDADEIKLVALRDYISKLAKMSSLIRPGYSSGQVANSEDASLLPPLLIKSTLAVQPLENVTPLTIFFDSGTGKAGAPLSLQGTLDAGTVSTRTPTLDSSFSSRMARKRLGGGRIVSDNATLNPLEELRRRMMLSSSDGETLALPSTPRQANDQTADDGLVEANGGRGSVAPLTATGNAPHGKLGIGKAQAATASTSAVVAGKMAERGTKVSSAEVKTEQSAGSGSNAPLPALRERTRSKAFDDAAADEPLFTSTYEGDDPYIKAHLEAVWLTTFQDRHPGLGPAVNAASRSRPGGRSTTAGARGGTVGGPANGINSNRRPEGNLVAYFTEHTGPVTAIVVSPDYAFFVSGSEDGTVKVWDTARLEKNVTSRSRSTYSGQHGKISSLVMLHASHCLASAATDGSVHVLRVEITSSTSASPSSLPRYGKMRLVSNFQLSNPEEYVVSMVQSSRKSGVSTQEASLASGGGAAAMNTYSGNGPPTSSTTGSTLLVATSKNRIVILDLRTMQVLSTLQNPPHLGAISALCIDPRNIWLIVGTIGGTLCLWDLRFLLLVKSWRVSSAACHANDDDMVEPSATRINTIVLHPSKGHGRWIMVAYEHLNLSFQGERKTSSSEPQTIVETWDIEGGSCVEEYDTVRGPRAEPADHVSHAVRHNRRKSAASAWKAECSGLASPADAIERLVKSHDAIMEQNNKSRSGDAKADALASQDSHKDDEEEEAQSRRIKGREVIPPPPLSSSVRAMLVSTEGYASSSLPHAAQISGGWLDAGRLAGSSTVGDNTGVFGKGKNASSAAGGPAGYMITGGLDRKIRFWDLGRADKSTAFGATSDDRNEFRMRVEDGSATRAGASWSGDTDVSARGGKIAGDSGGSAVAGGPAQHTHRPIRVSHLILPTTASSRAAATALRSPLLTNHASSATTNVLLKAHKDAITALAMIESPFRCVVAGDYAGNIRVWE